MATAAGRIVFLFFLSWLFCTGNANAQSNTPFLERTLSVTANNERLESVLSRISKEGGFSFSFNPDRIDTEKQITIRVSDKTIREVLNEIFAGEVGYKVKGGHVILRRIERPQESAKDPYYYISGYVTDGSNGEKLKETSIYEKNTRAAVVSNPYGFYSMKVDPKERAVELIVNKSQFRDTIIYVKQSGNAIINITIYPEEQKPEDVDSLALADSAMRADQAAFISFLLSEEQKVNTVNLKDTLHKKFQFTFLPFIGSNLRLSGNTTNDYSLNMLAGYSMGTRKLEIAGLVNMDRDSVRSWQVAGLANLDGGPVEGIQVAGLVNANRRTVTGMQAGGLINSNLDTVKGVQLAGLINMNLKSVNGFAAAGLLNTTLGDVSGVQAAGLMNVAFGDIKGVNVAGLANVCWKNIEGTQISGLLNIANHVSGSQLGFLNISNNCTGVPVGFLSLVRKGYHKLEISGDEVFPVNLSFRTGVQRFYNILTAGIQLKDFDLPLWHFGYGLGTTVGAGKMWSINFDLTTQQIVKGRGFDEMNLLSKFHVTADRKLTKNTSVAVGPTLNIYTSTVTVPYYESHFDKIPPYAFFNESYSNNLNIKMWVGGKLALRFF